MGKSRILLFMLFTLISVSQAFGQDVEMADLMRSSGKIYVVVGVILIIFGGILFYLFQTGKKVDKLESRIKELEDQK